MVGGTVGDSAFNAQLAGVVGQNAVENNYLSSAQIKQWSNEIRICQEKGQNCGPIINKYEDLSIKQQQELIAICSTNPQVCKEQYGSVLNDKMAVKKAIDQAIGEDIPIKMVYDLSALMMIHNEAEGIISSTEFAKNLKEKYGVSDYQAQVISAAAIGIASGIIKAKISSNTKDSITQNGYQFKKNIDLDLRGKNFTTRDALNIAFEKTGVPKNEFTVTKWGVDQNGKSFPVEYRVLSGKNRGAEVSVDLSHTSIGTPDAPHVGWQTPGKKNTVGHIFLDDVNVNRSKNKD